MSLFLGDYEDSAVESNFTVISKSRDEKNKQQQKTSVCYLQKGVSTLSV